MMEERTEGERQHIGGGKNIHVDGGGVLYKTTPGFH